MWLLSWIETMERGWGRGRDRWIRLIGINTGTEECSKCMCYAWRCCYVISVFGRLPFCGVVVNLLGLMKTRWEYKWSSIWGDDKLGDKQGDVIRSDVGRRGICRCLCRSRVDEGWMGERKDNISLMKDINDFQSHKLEKKITHLFRVPWTPDRVTKWALFREGPSYSTTWSFTSSAVIFS